jgi:hypothetical protein
MEDKKEIGELTVQEKKQDSETSTHSVISMK